MVKTSYPTWRLAIGLDASNDLSQLFAQIMADLPMSQRALAERIGVEQSTVARWVKGTKGRRTPPPETMMEAVEEVIAYLEPLLERATRAKNALDLLAEVQQAQDEGGRWAGKEQVEELEALLEGPGEAGQGEDAED